MVMAMKLTLYTSSTHQQSTYDLNAIQNCVELCSILEDDFQKIWYGSTSDQPVRMADSSKIKFYADIDYNGSPDSVIYYLDSMQAAYARSNANHKLIFRQVNTEPAVAMNLGVTRFKLSYYDSSGTKTEL